MSCFAEAEGWATSASVDCLPWSGAKLEATSLYHLLSESKCLTEATYGRRDLSGLVVSEFLSTVAQEAWGSGFVAAVARGRLLTGQLDQEAELNQPEVEVGTALSGLQTSARPHVLKVPWLAKASP